MIQHSIRPDFKDGFLLPYHAALKMAADNPDFDPERMAAFSPADRLIEFSHASQLVSHDGAIASLLACTESLRKAKGFVSYHWLNTGNGEGAGGEDEPEPHDGLNDPHQPRVLLHDGSKTLDARSAEKFASGPVGCDGGRQEPSSDCRAWV